MALMASFSRSQPPIVGDPAPGWVTQRHVLGYDPSVGSFSCTVWLLESESNLVPLLKYWRGPGCHGSEYCFGSYGGVPLGPSFETYFLFYNISNMCMFKPASANKLVQDKPHSLVKLLAKRRGGQGRLGPLESPQKPPTPSLVLEMRWRISLGGSTPKSFLINEQLLRTVPSSF